MTVFREITDADVEQAEIADDGPRHVEDAQPVGPEAVEQDRKRGDGREARGNLSRQRAEHVATKGRPTHRPGSRTSDRASDSARACGRPGAQGRRVTAGGP